MNVSECRRCGSDAINPQLHGRDPDFRWDLCDVCYWRERSEENTKRIVDLEKALVLAMHWLEDEVPPHITNELKLVSKNINKNGN